LSICRRAAEGGAAGEEMMFMGADGRWATWHQPD
jgi:hypothetical protein